MAGYDWKEKVLNMNQISTNKKDRSLKTGFSKNKWTPLQEPEPADLSGYEEFAMEEITLAAEAGVLPSKFHEIFATKSDMETFCALMRDNPWRVVNDRIAVAMETLLWGFAEDPDGNSYSNESLSRLILEAWEEEELEIENQSS